MWSDDHRVIVDAKYKNISQQQPGQSGQDNSLQWDAYQTLAYSRHDEARTTFGAVGADAASAIVLCYPSPDNRNAPDEVAISAAAALQGRDLLGFVHRCFYDFDLPVTLLSVPVPTA
jgi:5-methylcytosine-specific restriction endonuclease McrBC regulatory subunit McrC